LKKLVDKTDQHSHQRYLKKKKIECKENKKIDVSVFIKISLNAYLY